MSTMRCRIPLGYFYGHIVVLPEEVPQELTPNVLQLTCMDLEKQLNILSKLFEDISCRYSLACSKLKESLHPFLIADMKNALHLYTYMDISKDRMLGITNVDHSKIFNSYQVNIFIYFCNRFIIFCFFFLGNYYVPTPTKHYKKCDG